MRNPEVKQGFRIVDRQCRQAESHLVATNALLAASEILIFGEARGR
jgi:hypothetical protein